MRKSDYLLIGALLLLSLAGFALLNLRPQGSQKILIIQQDNTVVQRIPLKNVHQETKLLLPVQDGTLEVRYDKDGAWVASSPCPDKICMHQGKITEPGRTVACVPEKVLLLIDTPHKEAQHDAVLR